MPHAHTDTMDTRKLQKPVLKERPARGREMQTDEVGTGCGGKRPAVFYEGYVDDKRFLVPDTNLEAMADMIKFKMRRVENSTYMIDTEALKRGDVKDIYLEKMENMLKKLECLAEFGDEKEEETEENAEEEEKEVLEELPSSSSVDEKGEAEKEDKKKKKKKKTNERQRQREKAENILDRLELPVLVSQPLVKKPFQRTEKFNENYSDNTWETVGDSPRPYARSSRRMSPETRKTHNSDKNAKGGNPKGRDKRKGSLKQSPELEQEGDPINKGKD